MQNLILTTFLILFTTGCASVIKGTDQAMTFTSEPSGAELLVDGYSQGKTPLTVKLKKNEYETVTVKKNGYNTIIKPLEKTYDGIALLNIFWDLSTTDLISGAAYEYQPNVYHFTLEKSEPEETSKKSKKTNQDADLAD
jgi:hypothetical protein